jgi:hypothetical protein
METQWFPASKEVQDTEVIKIIVGICLQGQRLSFVCTLPEKGCNHHSKVLHCTSQQTEVAAGLQTFERNLVSSRQCCPSQGSHYAPEVGRSSL